MALPDFSKNFADQVSSGAAGDSTHGVQQEKVAAKRSSVQKVDIRYMLAVVVLTLSIVGSGGMFGLNAYLDREIVAVENGIEELEETIKINDIFDLAAFDKQVKILKSLATYRGGYLLLLTEVARLVVPGTHYSSVAISSGDDGYTITVTGVAESLKRYHKQIQRIETAEGLLAGGNFDGYSLQHGEDDDITVLFTVSFTVTIAKVAEILNGLS